jgi:hypothetical protein
MNCGAGKYKASAGVNAACDNCEVGKFKASAGVNTACDNCGAGKYSDAAGSNACTNCGSGKYVIAVGSQSSAACNNLCGPGYYRDGSSCTVIHHAPGSFCASPNDGVNMLSVAFTLLACFDPAAARVYATPSRHVVPASFAPPLVLW